MRPLSIYIGWDSREPAAFAVLADSILRRTTQAIAIVPLRLQALQRIYTRERGPTESTEFSLTRFLVPYLSNYEGYSLFLDCDMLCQADIGDVLLHALAHPEKAVYVCPHEYTPRDATKFLGQPQTAYPRKNWTSFMLFDNARCSMLTPEYVNSATGLELHRLQWLRDDQIGRLPLTWNWLSDEYPANPDAQLIHFTNGGPWFEASRACDHADRWFAARDQMLGLSLAVSV